MAEFDPVALLDQLAAKANAMYNRYLETGRLNRRQVDQLQAWVSALYTALGIQASK